jgi:hypothetical protein
MAGKKGFRSGVSIKSYYKNYANGMKWESNAERRLERHIKRQPDDVVAKQALKRLISRTKKYCRNRKSDGHICVDRPYISLVTARGDDRLTIIEQMENIGFKYRGRRNKRTTRPSMARVR